MISAITATPLGRRIVHGFGATALAPIVTAVIQLGPVPLLLHAWGAAKYGDWLVLSAIPSYLTLSNLGFGDASGSDMTARVAAGDRQGALETFQSSFALVAAVAAVTLVLAGIAVWWIPWRNWLHFSSLSDRQAANTILVLGAYVLIGQHCGILESGFRCDGRFALGTFWATILRFAEALFASAIGFFSGSLLYMALTYLVCRTLGTVAYGFLLYRKSPWLYIGRSHVRIDRLKQLAAPAIGFIALPLGFAVSLQGTIIVIGAVLGPLAVTAFSTLRTLTRLNSQLLNAIVWPIWPEFSVAFGANRIRLARRLFCHTYQIGVAVSAFTILVLWIAGPSIYRMWVRDTVSFDAGCFHILLLVTFADSLWYISSVVPMSTNTHHRVALVFLVGASVSLIAARFLLSRLGIDGAAWALLIVSLGMNWVALSTSLSRLNETLSSFFGSVLTLSPFRRAVRVNLDGIVSE